jgi:hypothetical protein
MVYNVNTRVVISFFFQVWFSGCHSDAWGPSHLAKNVLAFVARDLLQSGLHISFENDPWKDSPPASPTSWMMLLMRTLKRPRALLQGSNQFRHQTLETADFLIHPLLPASEEENVVRAQLGLPALMLEGVDLRVSSSSL